MNIVTVTSRQTIFDIAIEKYGSVDDVFKLFADDNTVMEYKTKIDESGNEINVGLGLMSNLTPGQKISIKSDPSNEPIVNYYAKRKLRSLTGYQYENTPQEITTPDFNPFDFNPDDFN